MYSIVLMAAMTTGGAEAPAFGGRFFAKHHATAYACCGYSSCCGYTSCCGYSYNTSYTLFNSCCGGCCGGVAYVKHPFLHRIFHGCTSHYHSCCGYSSCCGGGSSCCGYTTSCCGYTACNGCTGYAVPFGTYGVSNVYGSYSYSGLPPIVSNPAPAAGVESVPAQPKEAPKMDSPVAPAPAPMKSSQGISPNAGHLVLELPENAELHIDGVRMKSTGTRRQFHTPELVPGESYYYQVKVVYEKNGEVVSESRKVTVRSGETQLASFVTPRKDGSVIVKNQK